MAAFSTQTSHFKSSPFDYSIGEVLKLEEQKKEIKGTLGRSDPLYATFKQNLLEIRQATLPFRSYLHWKTSSLNTCEMKPYFFTKSDGHPFSRASKEDRKAVKSKLLASVASELEPRLRDLARIHVIHGSSTPALALMLLSENASPSLECTGDLLDRKIAPFNGKHDAGVTHAGVNQHHISGETIRSIKRCFKYTAPIPFTPASCAYLSNPFSQVMRYWDSLDFSSVVSSLIQWSDQFPELFDAKLPLYARQTDQLIEALELECENPHHEAAARQLIARLKRETLPAVPPLSPGSKRVFKEALFSIENPYLVEDSNATMRYMGLGAYPFWSYHALRLTQLKQWDFDAFERATPPAHREEWLGVIENEHQQIKFELENEIASLQRKKFAATYFSTHVPSGTIEAFDETLDRIELELVRLEKCYRHLLLALQPTKPVLQIPQDDKIRSLITHPAPLIFASTTLKPTPCGGRSQDQDPDEYLLKGPVRLGKSGMDLIYTDSEASKERIYTLLPDHLKSEITIRLFEEFNVGEIPLVHAPNQVDG